VVVATLLSVNAVALCKNHCDRFMNFELARRKKEEDNRFDCLPTFWFSTVYQLYDKSS